MTRQEANRDIIKKISEYNERYPDMRFHQILYNLDINQGELEMKEGVSTGNLVLIDKYNEESVKTLNRIKIPK